MTALRSLLFLLVAPGAAAFYVPVYVLSHGPRIIPQALAILAIPLWAAGAAIILACYWEFLVRGKGTPAPIDPPRTLVISGLYRYVRNPIYVGLLLALAGHFSWFGTASLAFYSVGAFVAVHMFVILYEEPTLKRRFGAAYEEYLRTVPRWIPRLGMGETGGPSASRTV